jgi:Matrixin
VKIKFSLLIAAAWMMLQPQALCYVLEGQSWTLDRTVVMQLSLKRNQVLSDGFTSFDQSAEDALNVWNLYLAHLHFSSILNSPVTAAQGDDEMSVVFSSTVFGDSFGKDVIAITLLDFRGSVMEETDTLFNTAITWDSYRGPLRPGVIDFHRVAMHEFGHTLGLDHPNEHNQQVVALMNSGVSDIDTVQPDDIAGVESLYATGPAYQSSLPAPNLVNISTRALIGTGEDVLIGGFIIQGSAPATVILRAIGYSLTAVGLTNAISDPIITVYNSAGAVVATNDDWFTSANAETISSFHLDPPNSLESALFLTLNPGSYTAIVQGFSDGISPAATGVGLFELYDLHTTSGRAGNLSTRGQVQGGDNVMIGGFIIGGSQSKQVVVRAIGPSLSSAGIANPLADPFLELHDANGNIIQSNDDWQSGPDAQTIASKGLAPTNAKESALLATLNPGSFTAIVRGVNGAIGLALVELYDLSPAPN